MAKKFKINASDGSIKRYSDVVPQEKRRYWYFTTHGIGPGMLPSDVKILETKEGQNKKGTWGDFICLDSVLNTDELKAYDLIELAPDMVESACGSKKSVKSATRKPLRKQAVKASAKKAIEASDYITDQLIQNTKSKPLKDAYDNGDLSVVMKDDVFWFEHTPSDRIAKLATKEIKRLYPNAKSLLEVGPKKPVKSSTKRRAVKASDVDADRPNSAPNSWKSSQRMAYKVTEDQTKGERSFPTSIDDVYKVLGEMQGTWTNPTTGWTGDCEIYERDLDDGSYIFSLVFGGNELEPDDILYVPGGFDYYSNKPKFTIYPHSGAPIFADSLEDFKRKLKKEYSYLRKVDDVNSACGKKKTVKASAVAKYKANRAIKAGINAPFTDGPLCVCENCKAEIESREGRQIVYNVISDLDIEPDERLICDWCEDEVTELYQISPDDVEGAKKAIKCAFDEGDPWEYQESYDYYYDEEPPEHIAKELGRLAKLTDMYKDRWFEKFEELHPNERFSSVDPHPDVDEAVGYTLDEAEFSPDDIKASTKAIKANDGIAPDDYDSVDDMVSDDTMAYDIAPDVAVAEIEGVENYLNGFELHLRVSYVEYNTPDDWVVDYNMYDDEVKGAFIDFVWFWDEDLYKEVFYNPNGADYDDILDAQDLQGQFYPNNNQLKLPHVSIDGKQLSGFGFTSEKYMEIYDKLSDLINKFNDFNEERFTAAQNQMGEFLEVKLPLMYPTLLGDSVEASESLNMQAGEDSPVGWHLYGYDINGEDVDTDYVSFQGDVESAVKALFSNSQIDTVDVYKILDDTGYDDYFETYTREDIKASTDVNADLQLNKNASDRKKYNWGKNPITDLDGYVKDIADGVVDRFPNLTYEISDEAITFTNNDSGEVVYIQSIDEIVPEKEDLENDTEELSNAIQHEQEESDWYNQNTDAVEMSTSDDELEPIMGDGFGEDDMGYGFDSNGEVITESVVEELYRIAEQDVLQHSKLAEIDEYVSIDEDSWKFYMSSPSVSVDFYIHFKITEKDIDFNSYVLPEANTVPDFNYYTADLDFDIYTKNGEITDVVLEEVKIYRPDGTYDEYDVAKFDTTFNKEAIINYVEHLAGDTVSDIYNAVTNL